MSREIDSADYTRIARLGGRGVTTAFSLMVFVAFILVCGGLVRSHGWFVRSDGTAYTSDFVVFWTVSELIRTGEPLRAYSSARLTELGLAIVGEDPDALFGWFYPPHALLVVAPLALMPLLQAWFVWAAVTLGAFALSLYALTGWLGVGLALGLPASFPSILVGQNGLLTAALIAGTLHFLDRRPWLAGLLLGALTYKPQFGPLFPLVLLATCRWRVTIVATATALALAVAAEGLFGPGAWMAFVDGMQNQALVLIGAGAWDWRRMQSAYGIAQALGGPRWLAVLLQGAVAALVAASVAWVWRSGASESVRGAALAAGTLLITPYVFNYDAPVMTVAVALLLREGFDCGFRVGDKVVLTLAALAPAIQFVTQFMTLPVASVMLLWVAVRRIDHR